MTSYAKAKGSTFERDTMAAGRARGHQVERLRATGREDEGDLVLFGGYGLVTIFECKARARMSLAEWMDEAVVEAANWASHRDHMGVSPVPAVLHKRRMRPILESYVTLQYGDYLDLNHLLKHRYDHDQR